MRLGAYLEKVDGCSNNGPLHCALSRGCNQGCYIEGFHPSSTIKAFGLSLIQYWHPEPEQFGREPCIRLTVRGHNLRKQLKGDFT